MKKKLNVITVLLFKVKVVFINYANAAAWALRS